MLQNERVSCRPSVTRFLRNESGGTAVEYGLIIGLIGLAVVVCLSAYGPAFREVLDRLGADIVRPTNTPGEG